MPPHACSRTAHSHSPSHMAAQPPRRRRPALKALHICLVAALGLVAGGLFLCHGTTGGSADAAKSAPKTTIVLTSTVAAPPAPADPPSLAEAKGAILVDASGRTLWGSGQDDTLPIASITKVMTAMVALDHTDDLERTIACRKYDLPDDAQSAGYGPGDKSTFLELFQVMLVHSANDAANEVADSTMDRKAFVDAMNAKAKEIGMDHTTFVNPSGLDEADGRQNVSTASDLALMGSYALTRYPLIAQTVMMPKITATIGGVSKTFRSTDDLIGRMPGAIGIKTGRVEAGTSFLGACERDGVRVYSCVLGCRTTEGRFADTGSLWSWAYDEVYPRFRFAAAGTPVGTVPFADHFGWTLDVVPVADADGLVEAGGGPIQKTETRCILGMALPGIVWRSVSWTQDGRTIAESVCVTGRPKPAARRAFAGLVSLGSLESR